jgi:hypothetical protein
LENISLEHKNLAPSQTSGARKPLEKKKKMVIIIIIIKKIIKKIIIINK